MYPPERLYPTWKRIVPAASAETAAAPETTDNRSAAEAATEGSTAAHAGSATDSGSASAPTRTAARVTTSAALAERQDGNHGEQNGDFQEFHRTGPPNSTLPLSVRRQLAGLRQRMVHTGPEPECRSAGSTRSTGPDDGSRDS